MFYFCVCVGDIIIGLHQIDDFWWQGQRGTALGMFPVTHVMELEESRVLKHRSQSVHSAEQLFAQALVDSVAQLDEELSFQVGDIISVTEVLDEDWYVGECRGKSGMFLASCVQLLNEEECCKSGVKNNSQDKKLGTQSIPKSDAIPPPEQSNFQSDVGHFTKQEHLNGEKGGDSVNSSKTQVSRDGNMYTSENTKAHINSDSDSGVTPYARTLYPFTGQNPGELSFNANDIVTLIQHVDEDWIEGEVDGQIGLFPANFVEVVVDCPYIFDTSSNTAPTVSTGNSIQESVATTGDLTNTQLSEMETNADESENYALVLYNFTAEADTDLSVVEGETVTVIKQVDDNWLLVRNESGKCGMCPITFVNIITAAPEETALTHDNYTSEIKAKNNVKNNIVETIETAKELNGSRNHINELKDSNISLRSTGSDSLVSDRKTTAETKQQLVSKSRSSSTSRSISSNQKPILAPKPALKPKPVISPKPFIKPNISITKPSHGASEPTPGIPKSSSSKSLVQYTKELSPDTENGAMTKAQSMFEINKTDLDTHVEELKVAHDDNSGTVSAIVSTKRISVDADNKKTFKNWDMTKPLDNLLHDEFAKAKKETEVKSRNSVNLSVTQESASYSTSGNTPSPKVGNRRHSSYVGNYSRENFESGLNDGLSYGNSTFFLSDFQNKPQQTRHLRKPPPPPSKRDTEEFTRKPSLKKPAPPRPAGPRMAPAPSKTPMIPEPTITKVPSHPGKIPPRPPGGAQRLSQARSPKPPARPVKSPSDNLMSFSPPNTSVGKISFSCTIIFFL